MRIQDAGQQQFVDYLLQIGEGKEITYTEIGDDIINYMMIWCLMKKQLNY